MNEMTEAKLLNCFYKEFARVTLKLRIGVDIKWVGDNEMFYFDGTSVFIPRPNNILNLFICFNQLGRVILGHYENEYLIPLQGEVEANKYANDMLFSNGIMPFENEGTLFVIALYKKLGLLVEGITDQYSYNEEEGLFFLTDNHTNVVVSDEIDKLSQFNNFLPKRATQFAALHYHLN
jgi:hypothetical protein